jgi:cytoskeleton protein RodZ
MASFGERMKREREMRGITLEEIADSTKIGSRSLRALEEEDFSQLPGGIFNKGFVRAYARYMGLDEDQAVADFLAAQNEAEQPQAILHPAEQPEAISNGTSLAWLKAMVVVLVIAALAVAGWHYRGKLANLTSGVIPGRQVETAPPPMQMAKEEPPVADQESSEEPALTLQGEAGAVENASLAGADIDRNAAASSLPADPRNRKKINVEIQVKQDTWVQITADGKLLSEGVLNAGTTRALKADRELTFKTGNAASVDLFFNGEALGPLGTDKQVRTLVFGPDGVKR